MFQKHPVTGNSAGDIFGMVKTKSFKWFSDLQIWDEKVTLNHLVAEFLGWILFQRVGRYLGTERTPKKAGNLPIETISISKFMAETPNYVRLPKGSIE